MADDPIGSYAPVQSVFPERDRKMPRQEKVYDPSTRKNRGGSGGGGGKKKSSEHGPGLEDINDEVSILGIPKAEMTKSVSDAINALLEEINFLKGELAKSHGHEAYLEEQVETDIDLHILRRHALTSKILQSVGRVRDENAPYSFIFITIKNASVTGSEFGRGAYEELIRQSASALREGLEQGDILGSLENHDFGIILPGNTAADAELKAQSLMLSLGGRKFVWEGNALDVDAGYGVAEINVGDNIEDILHKAANDQSQRA